MRPTLLAALILVALLGETSSAYQIITDLDDTVKITHTNNTADSVRRALFTNQIFSGMDTLLQHMSVSPSHPAITFISASPEMLRGKIRKLFERFQIPFDDLFLKPSRFKGSNYDYKYQIINDLLDGPSAPAIFFGDATEYDPQVYAQLSADYPDKVLKVYIHQIGNQQLYTNQTPYYTAFDVAWEEWEDGRMTEAQVLDVGSHIVNERRDKRIIPNWATCPSSRKNRRLAPNKMTAMKRLVEDRVQKVCSRHGLQ